MSPNHRMLARQHLTTTQVVSVYDLSRKDSLTAVMRMRMNAQRPRASPETFEEVVGLVGGRLTYMGKVAKAADMIKHAKHLLNVEKAWLLSQIGLIPDCDDDVMDEQKWSSCSWLLLREFVKRRQDDVARKREEIERGEAKPEDLDDLPLPRISYVRPYRALAGLVLMSILLLLRPFQYEARQIMTRADFMDGAHTVSYRSSIPLRYFHAENAPQNSTGKTSSPST